MSKGGASMSKQVRAAGHNAFRRAGVCAAAAIFAALTGQTLLAQSAAGSGTDALGIFQGLTPDQQQQILQRTGGSGTTSGTTTSAMNSQQPTDQQTQRRTRRDEDQALDGDQQAGGPPLFKGQDSVVVEVDLHPLKPRPVDTFSASAASSYTAQLQMQQTQQVTQAQQLLQAQQTAQDDTANLTDTERTRLQKLVSLIRSRNPYQLSRDGVLTLPGFSGIPLGGLTELQATLRLEVDPLLQGLHFRMTRLPLHKTGTEGLQPFGYDLFERDPSTFSPVTDVPGAGGLCARGPVISCRCSCTATRTAT